MARGTTARKETSGGASDALDLERLRRDLDAAGAERDAAEQVRADLDSARNDVLAEEDADALERHDHAVAAAKRRLDVAESRHARLLLEVQAAERIADEERRRVRYRTAERAITEARTIIREEYPAAARALADLLMRAAKLQAVGREANADLPEGAEPLDLMLETVFTGSHFRDGNRTTVEEYALVHRKTGEMAPSTVVAGPSYERRKIVRERPLPAIPAEPHKSVIDFVNLPGTGGPETYIYPAPRWAQPRSV